MFKRLFKKRGPRVVVLGIDGAPYTLLSGLADHGVMPNIARLREEGTFCPMSASIPEVSSTSWTTFMTGVNPGRHGIFGFMEIDRNTYTWRFPKSHDIKSKTIWEIAGENGRRSIVINIPSTYPAKPLNGMLVSGFVALDLKKASYPEGMYRYLNRIGYRLDVDASKASDRTEEFCRDIIYAFKKRVEAINYLFKNEKWDMFIAAITETDRLHHYLWSALKDPSHERHQFLLDFYRELDGFIGDFHKGIDSETPFIILSDHGFTEIKKEIYLNTYLKEKGYLKFKSPEPESFKDIEDATQAFLLDPSRIYIHTADKFSRGTVNSSHYDELRERIKEDMLSLEVDGNKVIKDVFFKEELYEGECFEDAPDLVLLPEEGFDLKGSLKAKDVAGMGPFTGGHTRENATFFINRQNIQDDNINIVDVGTTILSLMDIHVDGLDGRRLI